MTRRQRIKHTELIQQVQPGDVLVVYGGRGLISRLIAKLTYRGNGLWSHVGMAIEHEGKLQIIEATDDGVVLTPMHRFFTNHDKYAIVRCNQPFNLNRLTWQALEYLGTPYAWKQLWKDFLAVMFRIGRGRGAIKDLYGQDMPGITCPELPALCYEKQGIKVKSEEKDGVYVPPYFLAPNEYLDSFQFDLVAES